MRRLAHGLVAVLVAAALLPTAPSADAAARPMPIGVTAVRAAPAGPDQVRVTWRGGSRTTRYAFIAGSTSMTDVNHFQSRWIPASDRRVRARSVVLTVPVALRPVLGAGSGNYVFVKVVQTNATGSPPVCRLWTPASWCRASASGTSALAGSTRSAGPAFPLRVATWNVQSVSATQDADPAHRWASRLPKVVRAIRAAMPDVIGTQESTTARLDPACLNRQGAATASPCREQYMDLGTGLAPDYALAAPDAWLQPYRQQQRHAGDPRYSGYVDSAILYRTAAVELLDHGFISPFDDLGIAEFRTNDESGVWALLRDRASGQRFLTVSMHFPVGDGAAALRRKEAVALAAWLVRASAARGDVPVVVAADLNSYAGVDAQPAVAPLRAAGFTDAAATRVRTNPTWSSTNHSNTVGANSGYPTVAVPHPYPTNRIDYLLVRVAGASASTTFSDRYDNVVHLTPDRRDFDAEYQGSDHDMQVADLRLPIR